MQAGARVVELNAEIVSAINDVVAQDMEFDDFVMGAILEKIQDMRDIRDAIAILDNPSEWDNSIIA